MTIFTDRVEAGRKLAAELGNYARGNTIALAIPRGGVVVGYEIAHKLRIPLDIIVPRKLGAPNNPEMAIGAITEDGTIILDQQLVENLGVPESYIKEESARQHFEIKRRTNLYKQNAPSLNLKDCVVIIIDDGIATGATIRAALASIRKKNPKFVVIAVPVAPSSTINSLKRVADHVVCLFTPEPFYAIGQFFRDFTQTSDEEVIRLLKLNREDLRK